MRRLVRMVGLLLFLAVPACMAEREPPLRVGTQLWPGCEPFFLARDLGHLEDGSVRLVEYSSLSQTSRDFRNGMLDALNVTLDMALQLEQQGFQTRVVLVMGYSNGADALVARPDVRRLEELRGKRVAVEDQAVSTYILGRALQQAGLRPSDVHILRLPAGQHVRAYEAGQVDAVVTHQPFVSRLLAAGAQVLLHSGQLPGEIVDVLVVRADVLEARPEQVRHLLQGWFQALRHLEEHREDAVARMSPRTGTSPADFSATLEELRLLSLEENLALLREPDSPLVTAAWKLQRLMLEEGLLHEPVRPELLLDVRPLEALGEDR